MEENTNSNTGIKIITHPRSFGFEFRNQLLQGTLLNVGGKNDIFFFFAGKEYENSESFSKELNVTPEESTQLNEKINKIINSKY